MLHVWAVTIDYLRVRSTLTLVDSAEKPSILLIMQVIQEELRSHAIPAVLKRRNGRGYQLKSKDLDVHVLWSSGSACIDIYCHVDALVMRPAQLHERMISVHRVISAIRGFDLGPLQVYEIHLAVTFTGGGIGARSIRRIDSRRKLWPEPVPYRCGESYLYNKTMELQEPNKLRKRWIVDVCGEAGYKPADHGDLWRLEFRFKGDRITELGYPDMPLMWQNLMDQYPLMRGGSVRGKAVDPAWKRLRMASHTWPWEQPMHVWRPLPGDPGRRNRARGMFEYAVGVLLEDVPTSYSTAGEATQEVIQVHYPPGSPNEQDLLDSIQIERSETVSGATQLVFPFMETRQVARSA